MNASVVPAVAALALNSIEHSRKVLSGKGPNVTRLWVRVSAELSKALYSSIFRPELSPVMDSTSR